MSGTTIETVRGEVARLREDGGLVDLGAADRLMLTGEDRLRFLGGLVTCEVKTLTPGQGTYGFFTNIKGRLLSDVVILATDDSLILELPSGSGEAIAEHVTKYRIADRVEIERLENAHAISLVGARARDAEIPPGDWSNGPIEIEGEVEGEIDGNGAVVAFRDRRLGLPAVTLLTDAERAETILMADAGETTEAARAALEVIRIEAGRPRFGIDMSGDNFPQETGLDPETVSYEKGCYLGQEIVARIHYRGGVNRRLVGLRFDSGVEDGSPRGASLTLEGRAVGTISSFVRSPEHGPIGLAIVHKRAEDRQVLEVDGANRATVVPLPFGS